MKLKFSFLLLAVLCSLVLSLPAAKDRKREPIDYVPERFEPVPERFEPERFEPARKLLKKALNDMKETEGSEPEPEPMDYVPERFEPEPEPIDEPEEDEPISMIETILDENENEVNEAETLESEAETEGMDAETLESEAETLESEAETDVSEAEPLISEAETLESEAETDVSEAEPLISEAESVESEPLVLRKQLIAEDIKIEKGFFAACHGDIKRYSCLKDSQGSQVLQRATVMLCLENAMKKDMEVTAECTAEVDDMRKSIMKDFQISPEIVVHCDKEIQDHCGGGSNKEGKTLHCLMDLAQQVSFKGSQKIAKQISQSCEVQLSNLLHEADVGQD